MIWLRKKYNQFCYSRYNLLKIYSTFKLTVLKIEKKTIKSNSNQTFLLKHVLNNGNDIPWILRVSNILSSIKKCDVCYNFYPTWTDFIRIKNCLILVENSANMTVTINQNNYKNHYLTGEYIVDIL